MNSCTCDDCEPGTTADECMAARQRMRARRLRDEYIARLYEDARRLLGLAWRYQREGRVQAASECVELINEHRRTVAGLRKSPLVPTLAKAPAESGTQVNHQPARSNAA